MKTILQYLASWYWKRMRREERKLAAVRANVANYPSRIVWFTQAIKWDAKVQRKALRFKDKAETLERWARWWG